MYFNLGFSTHILLVVISVIICYTVVGDADHALSYGGKLFLTASEELKLNKISQEKIIKHPRINDASKQSTNGDGVVLIQIKNDTEYWDANNGILERLWWYCVRIGTTPTINTPAIWVRTDSIGGINKCVRKCAQFERCNTKQDFVNAFNSPLLRCTSGTGSKQCGAYETSIQAIRISDGEKVRVGIWFVPSPTPSPITLTPPITPTPSTSAWWFASASSIVSQSPTPSPVRKPEDFEIDEVQKDPQENARVVGTIIETELEKVIEQEDGIIDADVAVKIKISQTKTEGNSNNDGTEEEKGNLEVLNVARPARYCLPKRNCAVRVIITSKISLRKFLIAKALDTLRKAPNFSQVFRNTDRSFRIINKPLNTYIVVVRYKDSYLQRI